MSQGNALVTLPVLVQVGIIDKHDEIIVFALVVDLGLGCLAASHFGCGVESS